MVRSYYRETWTIIEKFLLGHWDISLEYPIISKTQHRAEMDEKLRKNWEIEEEERKEREKKMESLTHSLSELACLRPPTAYLRSPRGLREPA